MAMVTFDGQTKLILVHDGVTTLDVGVDLYSDWKEWATASTANLRWAPAFRSAGLEDLGGGRARGGAVFIQNGWKIRPHEAHHQLTLTGPLLVQDPPGSFIVPPQGPFTVLVSQIVPIDAQLLAGYEPAVVAGAVRTELTPELARMDTSVSSRASSVELAGVSSQVAVVSALLGGLAGVTDLVRKILTNRLELSAAYPNNHVLYDDDNSTPLLQWSVTDVNNAGIVLNPGVPARRSQGS